MKKLLLVTVFGLFACLSNAQENATETTYYQKIPRLVKQADGTYRVTGDYYFVPVEKTVRLTLLLLQRKQSKKKPQAQKVEHQNPTGTICRADGLICR